MPAENGVKAMGRKHLTLEERRLIRTLLDSGKNANQIAETLGRNNTSIYREIKRGMHNGRYDPEYSYALYKEALREKGVGPILSKNRKLASYIAERILEDELSPEQIVDLLQNKNDPELLPVNKNTIYSAIDAGLIPGVTRATLHHDVTKMYNRGCIMFPSWVRKKYGYKDGAMFKIVDNGNGEIILKPLTEGVKGQAVVLEEADR